MPDELAPAVEAPVPGVYVVPKRPPKVPGPDVKVLPVEVEGLAAGVKPNKPLAGVDKLAVVVVAPKTPWTGAGPNKLLPAAHESVVVETGRLPNKLLPAVAGADVPLVETGRLPNKLLPAAPESVVVETGRKLSQRADLRYALHARRQCTQP